MHFMCLISKIFHESQVKPSKSSDLQHTKLIVVIITFQMNCKDLWTRWLLAISDNTDIVR